jgi:hypothetical protein
MGCCKDIAVKFPGSPPAWRDKEVGKEDGHERREEQQEGKTEKRRKKMWAKEGNVSERAEIEGTMDVKEARTK